MAHRMKELVERFDGIAKEKERYQLKEGYVQRQPFISSTRETTSFVNESSVYGRDNEKEKLIDSLTKHGNESVLSIIPVVGMGGLGKTTLAQLVYNDEKSVPTHFDLKMWVYVSENFDLGKLLKEILESATKRKADQLNMELLQTRLREELSGKRYLLVLDDVWNDVRDEFVDKWHSLKTLLACGCGSMGSKVLITTRDDRVADIVGTLPTHQLGELSTEDSWRIFEKLVNPEQNLPQNLLSIGKETVGKCGGLPLAVKTLGGLMSFRKTEPYWESVKNREFWQLPDNKERVLSILRLSYDHLTSSLKQCFAYCAVIPKGDVIDKNILIKQWIAQGFIHSNRENELLEEKGEEFFEELLRRSLFQVDAETNDTNEELYKMHDLVHDLLKSVAGEEFIIVKASIDTIPSETRHLALEVDDKWVREPKNLDALKKCKKLGPIIKDGNIDINVCLSFRCLRMLVLSWSSIHFLPNSIDKLRHLRYFDISYTLITELPETICNLHNLQTLRVFSSCLQKLPKNMKRMISLRHIESGEWEDFPLPKGIGKLTFLRTLPKFIIAKESGARIEELKDLNLLWGNIHIGGLDNIGSVGCAREADLKAKKHVNSLKLSWSGDETVAAVGNAKEVIEVLEPHSDLKELSVENYMGLEFPSWITKRLTRLKKISLSSCDRCEHLPPLGQLPFLESLKIQGMDAIKDMVDFDGSQNYEDLFPSLKDLYLGYMPNLERWSSPQEDGDGDEQGRERERDKQVIFKCLRTLNIYDCPKLVRPPWLPLLPRLESLETGGMGWDMIEIPTSKSLMKVELGEMPNLERWSPHQADDGTPVIFCSVRTLSISDCPKPICLPMFLLPALEELKMSKVGCERIEFSRSHSLSKSLKKVELTEMPNLEIWSPQQADDYEQVVFDGLVELVVKECPRMVRLPHFLPSLQILKISESNEMLLASVANYTSLSELFIGGLLEVKHFPDELGPNHTSLHTLVIRKCPKLISLSNQLENLLALKKLIVEGCNDLVLSLQQQRPPLNSLEVLKISHSCEKQNSLPGDGIVLPSLKKLRINSCTSIESLSADMLKNLTALSIVDSPKVSYSLVSLENLKSLQDLMISGCPESVMMKLLEPMESLTSLSKLSIEDCPDMRSLPKSVKTFTSLTRLKISKCPAMMSLPEWVGDLTLLKSLDIDTCPAMMSLPEELQRLKNLKWLYIKQCPALGKRLQRNKGQDWHKVAHVRYIRDLGGIASQDTEGEESSDQCPHLLLHSLKKLEKLLPLPSCCSSSPSSSSPPPT